MEFLWRLFVHYHNVFINECPGPQTTHLVFQVTERLREWSKIFAGGRLLSFGSRALVMRARAAASTDLPSWARRNDADDDSVMPSGKRVVVLSGHTAALILPEWVVG